MSEYNLPMSKVRLRPMHLRGIYNCIKAGMYDLDEIAVASGLDCAEQIEPALTKVNKMNLANNKKRAEKPKKPKKKKEE